MWEDRSETLKEYTYDTSGFGRSCAPVHCAHPFFLLIAYHRLVGRISFQAAPHGAKLHLTELRLTFLSSAES